MNAETMEHEYSQQLKKLEQDIGYTFKKRSLLIQALTHSSYSNETDAERFPDNERLEFLGDAVLGFTVSGLLFDMFNDQEGILTNAKNYLVNATTLFTIADQLELGSYLLLGKGEEKSRGRRKESLLENSLEALIGAMYLDGTIAEAKKFIERNFLPLLEEHSHESIKRRDFKSYLQESLQAEGIPTPEYHVTNEEGPDHEKEFTVELSINGQVISEGKGRSKKQAQQIAAELVLTLMDQGKITLKDITHPND